MVSYLLNHYRYDTMNSWNRATSYAQNVKLNRLSGLTREQADKCFDALQVEDSFDDVNYLISEFTDRWDGQWTIGFNGRSGGYMVLYRSERKQSEHKSICTKCGQRNFRTVEESGTKCGRCGAESRVNRTFTELVVRPGMGTDEEGDFEDRDEWSMYDLRQRVNVVWDFDKTVVQCIAAFVDFAISHEVVEETVMVPTKVMVAR